MSALPPQPISPLDGRYQRVVAELGDHLSEAALNRNRVHVEVEWLILLAANGVFGVQKLTDAQVATLRSIVSDFSQDHIDQLAELEATTRHDVKAVEYLLRAHLDANGMSHLAELVHFACTSEDINNLAYGIGITRAVHDVWLPALNRGIDALADMAVKYRDAAMLSRTHGQPATPTTMGKELAVFAHRLQRVRDQILAVQPLGKFSGATGTFSAHVVADPDRNWTELSAELVTGLGLVWNPLTTQIESHDWQAELYNRVAHVNRILHNLATDVWTYISLGYFRQIPVAGATGSSTMPHKINPIRFENAEANLELSSALFDSLAATLVTTRLQRDLTDSTTQRNIGVAFGHSLVALDNIVRGLAEIDLATEVLEADLAANWEVLAEAIQTLVRAEITAGSSSISDPYVLLKELTRGKRITADDLASFIETLDISQPAKARLRELTPANYIGLASELVSLLGR